jgi:hypothetical protein
MRERERERESLLWFATFKVIEPFGRDEKLVNVSHDRPVKLKPLESQDDKEEGK